MDVRSAPPVVVVVVIRFQISFSVLLSCTTHLSLAERTVCWPVLTTAKGPSTPRCFSVLCICIRLFTFWTRRFQYTLRTDQQCRIPWKRWLHSRFPTPGTVYRYQQHPHIKWSLQIGYQQLQQTLRFDPLFPIAKTQCHLSVIHYL